MRKIHHIIIVPIITIILLQGYSSFALGGFDTPTSSVTGESTPTITKSTETSPSPPKNPTPTGNLHLTPTSIPTTVIQKTVTPTPEINPTVTPVPNPTATPTPQPEIVAPVNPTLTPEPNLATSLIDFPKNVLSYIAPKNAYGSRVLPLDISLEFLALGSALVAIGILVLRWEESDRSIVAEMKHMGVALRSWLL